MRAWLPHLVCCALLALEIGVFVVASDSDAEVERALAEGTVEERLAALHIATNRGEPDAARFGEAFVRSLLAEPDERLEEAAFTLDVCKFEIPELQTRILQKPWEATPLWWRSYVIHRRKVGGYRVGGGSGLTHQELLWYLDALRERSLPVEEIVAHLRRLGDESRRRQDALGIEPESERWRGRD